MSFRKRVQNMANEAFDDWRAFHDQFEFENAAYENGGAYNASTRVGRSVAVAGEQLYPKITEVANAILPPLESSLPRVSLGPDRSYRKDADALWVQALQNWYDMVLDADGEQDLMRTALHHIVVGGFAVRKMRVDPVHNAITTEVLHPSSFAASGGGRVDLRDTDYIAHRNRRSRFYVQRWYPEFLPQPNEESVTVDEIWMRRHVAEDLGLDIKKSKRRIFRVVSIGEGRTVLKRPSPWWWPDFPFACCRNFMTVGSDGEQPNNLWGFGLASLLWPQQKVLDHLLANLTLIVNNIAVGRFQSKYGALDMEQVLALHGANIELNEGFEISDVIHLPPEQLPAGYYQMIDLVIGVMDRVSKVTDVFTGEAPEGQLSGRAIAAIQAAAFSQISSLTRQINEFRARLARMRVVFIQQTAKRPLPLHMWRGGLDLPDMFPEQARHIGFTVSIPDASSLPVTPAGRLQWVQALQAIGIQLSQSKILDLLKLDTGFGIREEDLVQPLSLAGVGDAATLDGAPTAA